MQRFGLSFAVVYNLFVFAQNFENPVRARFRARNFGQHRSDFVKRFGIAVGVT